MSRLSGLKALFDNALPMAQKGLDVAAGKGKDIADKAGKTYMNAFNSTDPFTRYGTRVTSVGLGTTGLGVPAISALNERKRKNLIQQSANILSEAEKNNRDIDFGSNEPFYNALKLSAAIGIPSLALVIAAKMISNKHNKG